MTEENEAHIDSKLKTAMQFARGGNRDEASSRYKSVLEGKAVQEIGVVVDANNSDNGTRQLKKYSTKSDQTPGPYSIASIH